MPNGMIEPGHPKVSVAAQWRLLRVSRSAFHSAPQGETAMNLGLMLLIDKQFLDTPFYGVRQMTWHLRNQGHAVHEKRIRRLMRLMGVRRENSVPHCFPTLLTADLPETQHQQAREGPQELSLSAAGLLVNRPNQVWCTDITDIPMRRGFLDLIAVMDWHTRKVLAWRISNIEPWSATGSRTMARGHRLLPRGAERGHPPLWGAGHHEPRSRLAVHVLRLDRPAETGGHQDIDGRQRPLYRQPSGIPSDQWQSCPRHVASVAVAEI